MTDPAAAEGCRIHTPEVWACARHDYLRGHSAERVCSDYDIALSTFRDRARREGWRKMDQADQSDDGLVYCYDPVEDEDDDTPVDLDALAADALKRVRRAMQAGRAAEAASWMRLHDKLTAQIRTAKAEAEAAKAGADKPRRPRGDPALAAAIHDTKIGLQIARGQMQLESAVVSGTMRPDIAERLSALYDKHLPPLEDTAPRPADSHHSDPFFSEPDRNALADPPDPFDTWSDDPLSCPWPRPD